MVAQARDASPHEQGGSGAKRALRKRLARLAAAGSLALAVGVSATPAFALRAADDFNVQCVYYTETIGACWSPYRSDNYIEHHMYFFWGNCYWRVS